MIRLRQLKIVEVASRQVARVWVNVGSFQSFTVESTQNMLASAQKSLSWAITKICDTDYAIEITNLARLNVLQQA